jgi:hypothetical protein
MINCSRPALGCRLEQTLSMSLSRNSRSGEMRLASRATRSRRRSERSLCLMTTRNPVTRALSLPPMSANRAWRLCPVVRLPETSSLKGTPTILAWTSNPRGVYQGGLSWSSRTLCHILLLCRHHYTDSRRPSRFVGNLNHIHPLVRLLEMRSTWPIVDQWIRKSAGVSFLFINTD